MLIKFESKRAAPFHMQKEVATQLLSMMGQAAKLEGSISGTELDAALRSLEAALAKEVDETIDPMDEEAERDFVSIAARAAPLKDMLMHAKKVSGYVMWSPD